MGAVHSTISRFYVNYFIKTLYSRFITADNREKAGESGAIDVILNAIITNLYNYNICYNGCNALLNITDKCKNNH